MSFLLYDKIFLGPLIWCPLRENIIWFSTLHYTIVLGFSMVLTAFFLIRLNYHLSGAITIREQFIDIIILAERYKIIFI